MIYYISKTDGMIIATHESGQDVPEGAYPGTVRVDAEILPETISQEDIAAWEIADQNRLRPLEAWRFHAAIEIAGLTETLATVISAMPAAQKAVVNSRLNRSTIYHRDDPLFDQLAPMIGITADAIDQMWREALTL